MKHPTEGDLALYAGGEAGLWRGLCVARHLKYCAGCARLAREFRAVRDWTRGEDELPEGVEWLQLSAEMKANIRVGLAAGECVAPREAGGRRLWRPAMVLPVLLVMVLGWWLQSWPPPPAPVAERMAPAGLVMRAKPGSIEVEQDGRALAVLYPPAAEVTLSASGGTLRARYVDAETGYVTISHVYTQ
jgi:hypothetical protein